MPRSPTRSRSAEAPGRLGLAAAVVAVGVVLLWAALAPRDPARFPEAGGTRIVRVVDHGFHTGLVLRAGDLRAAAVRLGRQDPESAARLRRLAAEWPHASALEIGWGDADFYQATPRLQDVDVALGLGALFWPTPSVVQVVPIWGPGAAVFAGIRHRDLALSEAGFAALARAVAATFHTDPARRFRPTGPSLYGAGRFFPATPSYHALRTCNHWTSAMLRAGGVPSSWIASATSWGLMTELALRL